jgi:hypothetical protein
MLPKDYLLNLSPEERLAMREKTKATLDAKKLAGELLFKQDSDDVKLWKQLAAKAGVRLPQAYVPASEVKYIKKVLKKLDIPITEWLDVEQSKSLKEFSILNPTWGAQAHVGLLLEYYYDENKLPAGEK